MDPPINGIIGEGYGTTNPTITVDPMVLDWMDEIPFNDLGSFHDLNNVDNDGSTKLLQRPAFTVLDPYSFETIRNVDNESDHSWTEEDDAGPLFFDIEQRLRAFHLQDDQKEMTIQPLTRDQRRVVHAMAHLMHLGHSSIKADGKVRRMHVFKKSNSDMMSGQSTEYTGSSFHTSLESFFTQDGIEGACDVDRSATIKRLPKKENGFQCRFSDCQKLFDRACDRKKHEKRHEPKESHPYHCSWQGCDKTFIYPKDLKRHEKVHLKRNNLIGADEQYSTDEMFSDASFSSMSRSSSMVEPDAANELAWFDASEDAFVTR